MSDPRFPPPAALLRQRPVQLVILILAAVLLGAVADRSFLRPVVWLDILTRCMPALIVSCGVMLVMVIRQIDISTGSLLGLLAAVLGRLLSEQHQHWPLIAGIPAVLLLGTCCGAITGCLVAIGRVPAIIVTLGLLTGLRGLTTLLMQGRTIDGLPAALTAAARGGHGWLPLGVWLGLLTLAGTWYLTERTALGRRLYALGSSPASARLAGLPERRLTILVYAWTGFLVGVATIAEVPRLPRIEAGLGVGFELLVVTSVIVGGVSVQGGRGSVVGVALAVLLMTLVRPLMTFVDAGEAAEKWTRAIQGVFILLAVAADAWPLRGSGAGRRPPHDGGGLPGKGTAAPGSAAP